VGVASLGLTVGPLLVVEIAQDHSGSPAALQRRASCGVAPRPALNLRAVASLHVGAHREAKVRLELAEDKSHSVVTLLNIKRAVFKRFHQRILHENAKAVLFEFLITPIGAVTNSESDPRDRLA
jgi:hypothetical protein